MTMKDDELKAIRARCEVASQDTSALLDEIDRLQAALHVDRELEAEHNKWSGRAKLLEEVLEEVLKLLLSLKKEEL